MSNNPITVVALSYLAAQSIRDGLESTSAQAFSVHSHDVTKHLFPDTLIPEVPYSMESRLSASAPAYTSRESLRPMRARREAD
ncbi:MAG TPA: hypothetical protein VJB66_05760 [Candidatus Nanoarchaeia archaeon]|nr:hypothetical protein [Candidatus Nanoarchaeia archaeon]